MSNVDHYFFNCQRSSVVRTSPNSCQAIKQPIVRHLVKAATSIQSGIPVILVINGSLHPKAAGSNLLRLGINQTNRSNLRGLFWYPGWGWGDMLFPR
ncbi:hypothetical protein AVEN_19599-1 [Araneus ventricosus]|uniref:Uncharacterized protein n=1 Tax=Araneus ventricosus TaxID=182803 RepID=A0A4Y2KV94_ARAVE|nr:hypothetical protein AVEN_19599-1 [Araneus ventricosus]